MQPGGRQCRRQVPRLSSFVFRSDTLCHTSPRALLGVNHLKCGYPVAWNGWSAVGVEGGAHRGEGEGGKVVRPLAVG